MNVTLKTREVEVSEASLVSRGPISPQGMVNGQGAPNF